MRYSILTFIFTIAVVLPARAQHAIDAHVTETIDFATVAQGGDDHRMRVLDNLDAIADADLDKLIGWVQAAAHVHVLNNMGTRPNDGAGTLQGVDNIEVSTHRLRLFEAWIEQRIGAHTSVRAGLYNLNTEFYANEAAGLLLAPAYGVGSEFAATGPNGPSIFPSTALAVRIDHRVEGLGYIRAVVLNGNAGTLGDPRGVDLSFRYGALLVGEAGVQRKGLKLAAGYWRYTHRQDDYTETGADGAPLKRLAHGGYALAELHLAGGEDTRSLKAFARIGLSDGKTTPFQGGWQTGLLVERVVRGRPDSALSFGISRGITTPGYRGMMRDNALRAANAESAFELTYSDRVSRHLTVQPDVQVIFDRNGEEGGPAVVMTTLRLKLAL